MKILNIIKFNDYKTIYLSIIAIILGILVYFLFKNIFLKFMQKNIKGKKIDKRKLTYFKLLMSIVKYIFILLIIAFILSINGINVTSIIAGLGVISIIAGLALQDALKDIIMGLNIIFDNYFSVGDVLKIGGVEGKVLEIGLKVTKLKDINNDNIFVIANRNISEFLTLSGVFFIDIPLIHEEKLDNIEKVINIIVKEISKLENVSNCEYKGIKYFGDSAISYRLKVDSFPEIKNQTSRDAKRIIKRILDSKNIEIPYTQ